MIDKRGEYAEQVPRPSSGSRTQRAPPRTGRRTLPLTLGRCRPSSSTPPIRPSPTSRKATAELAEGIAAGDDFQTLLGVTGSGKTATMGFVIEQVQKPTLVLAHNKTLAAQLCSEFREFFPDNAVEYFVSYYDYYQPEAYVPHQDLYIEKDSSINDEIDRLRHAATASLFAREDVIIVASVSCIYGIGSPELYKQKMLLLQAGRVDRPRRDAAPARLDAVRPQRPEPRARQLPRARRGARGASRPTPRAPTGSSCSATRSSRSSTSTRSPARSTTTSATCRSGRRPTT